MTADITGPITATAAGRLVHLLHQDPVTEEIYGANGLPHSGLNSLVSEYGKGDPFVPYAIATFGDSRSNTGSASPDTSTYQLLNDVRSSVWAVAQLGDCEITRNYGVSGDAAVNWNLAARNDGKTFTDLDASALDAVIVQYGINDAMSGTSATTITAALKALCTQIIKSSKRVVFESIQPIRAPATNPATTQATVDAVNAAMLGWIGTLPPSQASYADTASVLKSADGYANPTYYNSDGIHLIAAGARAARSVLAAAVRTLLPAKNGLFPAVDATSTNLLNLLTPNAFSVFEAGTGVAVVSYGQDQRGYYVQWDVTPATFASGECRARLDLSANFQTANPPYYALVGNEVLQGSAQVLVDNGAGGAPNCYAVGARQRFYTGSVFRDWGTLPAGAPGAKLPDYADPIDVRMVTPRMVNSTASVVANPSESDGYQLQIFLSSQNTTPYRVRVYNPQLRRVGWSRALMSVTPPASAAAYTNNLSVRQQVIVSGGTVSSIAINGTATGLTSGVFVLQPGDTLTPNYTVAPAMYSKPIA